MREWMRNVRRVEPYVPGEQPQTRDVTKLNTNENPYPPSPDVIKALAEVDEDSLRRYPDPDCRVLREALAECYHIDKERIFVGVGSDDVLATAFLTFFCSEKPLLFPDISYAFYPVWAELFGIPYEKQPLDEAFRLVKEDYLKENGGIVFPNPNAPTSILEPVSFVEDIVSKNPGSVVIVDEAYIDFGGTSALPLTEKYDNLLVVQTFSKSRSLAGLRIGFAMGDPALIAAMNAVKNSYNSYTLNQASLAAGTAAVKDTAYFKDTVARIVRTREEAVGRLAALGFTGPAPSANFLFVRHERLAAGELFYALREANIFVRYFDRPRIDNYLRITVGTPEQMERLYDFLASYIGKH